MWLLTGFPFEIMATEQVKVSLFRLLVALKYNIVGNSGFKSSLNEIQVKYLICLIGLYNLDLIHSCIQIGSPLPKCLPGAASSAHVRDSFIILNEIVFPLCPFITLYLLFTMVSGNKLDDSCFENLIYIQTSFSVFKWCNEEFSCGLSQSSLKCSALLLRLIPLQSRVHC